MNVERVISVQSKLNVERYNRSIEAILLTSVFIEFNYLSTALNTCKELNTEMRLSVRKLNNQKPWITHEILSLVKERDRYHRLLKKLKINRRTTRSNYNSLLIMKNLNKPKMMWKQINNILRNKENVVTLVPTLQNNDGLALTNRSEIANQLNEYFKNVGKLLFQHISACINNEQNLIQYNLNSMFIFDVTSNKIIQKIKNIKNSKSMKGAMSANTCKTHMQLLAPIICNLINKCFHEGSFPTELKLSRIIPIFKDGNPLLSIDQSVFCRYYQKHLNQSFVID